MKNLYTTLFLISFGMIANLSAQTLKNIYRHNQPVLRIPTHLIDKVETAEVNGTQVLQVRQFNGFVSEIPLSVIDSITHSEGEAVDPAQLGNLRTASVMGVVSGPTGAPEMNAIVRSPFGGEETRTDPNGVFFLNNILVYDKLGYITITKPGFHQASRSFLPLETGSSRVNVQLLPMTQSGTFSAATGGTVTSGLLQLTFPANAIQLNGQPFTGTVRVYAAALDPTSTTMFDQMPGELLGGLNDSLRLLRSFGMASVELRDISMNELQLATGVNATLTFNIPTSLQTEAPETIDWWSFDETLGYWKHEGQAIKQDSQYVGQASHFSWWNCDRPEEFNNLQGIITSAGGTPVSDAQVNVVTSSMGNGVTYTNAEGVFSGRVPKNQQLTLNVFLTCNTTNDWALEHIETINSQTVPLTSNISVNLENRYPISGTVLNCAGVAVNSGYVKLGFQIFMLKDQGVFTIQTCATGTYLIRGYDTSIPDSIKVSTPFTVQVGAQGSLDNSIQACSSFFSNISDIEGNYYPIVIIGSQWWMAENLRTSTYSNGDLIPNITEDAAWEQLNTGAWCNYVNQESYSVTYGKLYNGYTASDPRNLCPIGWHVPTYNEWITLINYLGGSDDAGGKMKSIYGWAAPNTSATNESSFSGLPGGYRNDISYFYYVNSFGLWWTKSEGSATDAYRLGLSKNDGIAQMFITSKRFGYSVRCVKD
jgi:uncharacterized protein (TIGR02145 family)